MGMLAVVNVNDGRTEEAILGFLKSLIEKGIIDDLIVPKRLPSGEGVVQTLVQDLAMLEGTCPLAPTLPVQSARIVSNLTLRNMNKKVGVLLKACEIRAIVELSKFLQVKLDHLTLIGIDCPGTFEVLDYARMFQEGKGGETLTRELLKGMEGGEASAPSGFTFRTACQICEYPVTQADIHIRLFGYPTGQQIGIEIGERWDKEVHEKMSLTFVEKEPSSRGEVLSRVIAERTKKRDEAFQEFQGGIKDLGVFLDRFSTCIRCHNCMVACPICYCKECVFKTETFEHEGDQFLKWAERKGGIRMPTDTLIFHLIRMAHMVTSCIGCGLCDSACPSRLPVATLFRSVGHRIQKMFDYVPGRDPHETPPVASFKEDELKMESGSH